MEQTFEWPPLESDPEIFTKYLYQLGMSDEWKVAEIFGLDEDCLGFVPQPCLAAIATFERKSPDGKPGSLDNVVKYYMKQSGKLDNACGIIACLHSVLNNLDSIKIKEESVLAKFIEGTKDLTPAERSNYMEEFKEFQDVHATFANQGQSSHPENQEQVKHHFVAFARGPDGKLIEFDGCKDGPSVIAESCEDFLKTVAAEVTRRLENGIISESISLMALAKNE